MRDPRISPYKANTLPYIYFNTYKKSVILEKFHIGSTSVWTIIDLEIFWEKK